MLLIFLNFRVLQAGSNVLHISSSMGSLDTYNESEGLITAQEQFEGGKPSIFISIIGCVCLLVLYITCGAAFVADTQNIEFRLV